MTLKSYILSILTAFLFLLMAHPTFAVLNKVDQDSVVNVVSLIVKDINNSNGADIKNILSPNASETLKMDIQNNVLGKRILYQESITKVSELEPGKVRVDGKFAASGDGWNMSGMSNYFVFEKVNGKWYLVDSDFAANLSASYVGGFIGKIFLILSPLFLIFFAFWVWMLIDLIKRPVENKVVWLLMMLFLGWIGSVIYFFAVRRKYIKSAKENPTTPAQMQVSPDSDLTKPIQPTQPSKPVQSTEPKQSSESALGEDTIVE